MCVLNFKFYDRKNDVFGFYDDESIDEISFTDDGSPEGTRVRSDHTLGECILNPEIEVIQAFGLTDKNGVQAFEKDICRAVLVSNKGVRESHIGVICFSEFEVCLETTSHQWPIASWKCVESFEIIGNELTSPELLGKLAG